MNLKNTSPIFIKLARENRHLPKKEKEKIPLKYITLNKEDINLL